MTRIKDALHRFQSDEDCPTAGTSSSHKEGTSMVASGDDAKPVSTTTVTKVKARSAHRTLHIDMGTMCKAGLVAPIADQRVFEEEYRIIKRPLLSNAFGRDAVCGGNGNSIMVTSSLAGEGKTFTSINLAFSLAKEKGTSVILVDADVLKAHITTFFDAEDEKGLLDFLDEPETPIETVVVPTNIDGLSIVPSGVPRNNTTELISSERMSDFIAQASSIGNRQIVLFDSPPLLQTTESIALAGVAGQVVLVVQAGATLQEVVQQSISILDESKPLNLVLNQALSPQGKGYYGDYDARQYSRKSSIDFASR